MDTLATLANDLYNATKEEQRAKERRIAIEEEIASMVETGDNGSKTVKASEHFKVVVKRSMRYTADIDALLAMADAVDNDFLPVMEVPASLKFDEKKYEQIREANPSVFNQLAQHVVAKPAKVSVTLKLN